MTEIRAGSVWRYKGKRYRVQSVFEKELTQHEDAWWPTVKYRCHPDNGLGFNRALPDWLGKFEECGEDHV